ncbi:MAG: FumA C-terminus/TtdB family hydratase beta subunit [candidate division WOR-3 bacterium]
MKKFYLKTPLLEKDVKILSIGDIIFLTGKVFTARDETHKRLIELKKNEKELPFNLHEMALFHSGPIVRKEKGKWVVLSGGPTTSIRMENLESDFLSLFNVKMIIGKGGMGEKTLKALERVGAVYTHFPGGAGVLAAKCIKKVENVYFLEELGIPEALWILEVENFGPLLVTMDARGNSFYNDLMRKWMKNLEKIKRRIIKEL